jgi:uncharacterized protein YndB with AHSA1/START domain
MTERFITHASFTIEREFAASPARVFAAWSRPEAKAAWFAGPEEFAGGTREFDFRVGGRETNGGGPEGGPFFFFDARYQDIVPNERIVYTYDMLMDDTRISVSLATVELRPSGSGTRLVYTELGAFLDGHDDPKAREHGTNELLDALGAHLRRETADAN